MFQRLNRLEDRSPGQVHSAMALANLLRDRFGIKEATPLIAARDALSLALDAWMAGDDKLACEFLIPAYLSDPVGS
jgi:hypothetical protein